METNSALAPLHDRIAQLITDYEKCPHGQTIPTWDTVGLFAALLREAAPPALTAREAEQSKPDEAVLKTAQLYLGVFCTQTSDKHPVVGHLQTVLRALTACEQERGRLEEAILKSIKQHSSNGCGDWPSCLTLKRAVEARLARKEI